jgi:hypothetical protein
MPPQLVKDPPDIGLFDVAFLPSHIYERGGKMPQLKFAGDAVSLLDVDGCGLKVVVKLLKFTLESMVL